MSFVFDGLKSKYQIVHKLHESISK